MSDHQASTRNGPTLRRRSFIRTLGPSFGLHRLTRALGCVVLAASCCTGTTRAEDVTLPREPDIMIVTDTAAQTVTGRETGMPIPRFVSLKAREANLRRGPARDHRIDWILTKKGTPLQIVAEYELWRKVVDVDGEGGWIHSALLSGTRTALVRNDWEPLHLAESASSRVVAKAERGVIATILSCAPDWCRVESAGEKGWIHKSGLWGVNPDEIIE